jgi:CheY-like chemotaxis protein
MKKKFKILIVEDQQIVLRALDEYFSEYFEVFLATNGIEALETIKNIGPIEIDAVISDIKMPEMNGLEFTKQFKELYPKTPVILLTGYDDNIMDAKRVHADAFFKKPVELLDIYQQLLHLLAGTTNKVSSRHSPKNAPTTTKSKPKPKPKKK